MVFNVAEERTVAVSDEQGPPAITRPMANVVYSARVEDNTGAPIRPGFTAKLIIIGDITVDVPFSDHYDESMRTLTVSFPAPPAPGVFVVILEWGEQVVQAGDIFIVYKPHLSYYTWGGT